MKIGILTYAYVPNFGANLQALSTYHYLKNNGHTPILILWEPIGLHEKFAKQKSEQTFAHFSFVKESMETTAMCRTDGEIKKEIHRNGIEAVIIGSDAVLQHHPLISRIHLPCKKIIYIEENTEERLYPNAFWGTFNDEKIPMVLMSASSQNSEYYWIHGQKRRLMSASLRQFKYISVRDTWTQKMVRYITHGQIIPNITPDPVFCFNVNAGQLVPKKETILEKFHLPENYCLVSFRTPELVDSLWIHGLKEEAKQKGLECVALPMPGGVQFRHDFNHEIKTPLSPIDWYALIKYSNGYIGENMHPVIVALHNNVPVYSFDTYGVTRFYKLYCDQSSSKIHNILSRFGLERTNYICASRRFYKRPTAESIVSAIHEFDYEKARNVAQNLQKEYQAMMRDILRRLDNK